MWCIRHAKHVHIPEVNTVAPQLTACSNSNHCNYGNVCQNGYCMKVFCYSDYQCPSGVIALKCISGVCTVPTNYNSYYNYIRNTRESQVLCPDGKVANRSCTTGCFYGQICLQGQCCSPAQSQPKPPPAPSPPPGNVLVSTNSSLKCGNGGSMQLTAPSFFRTEQPIACSPNAPCSSQAICNPKTDYCCTSLTICSKAKPLVDSFTKKPRSCYQSVNPAAVCGSGYECQDTGFCCKKDIPITPIPAIPQGRINGTCLNSGQCYGVGTECRMGTCQCRPGTEFNGADCLRENNEIPGLTNAPCSQGQCFSINTECHLNKCVCKSGTSFNGIDCIVDSEVAVVLPKPGQPCDSELLSQCDSLNAYCDCSTSQGCMCKCIEELGYVHQGEECVRARRKLGETCEHNSHCSTAYTECMTSNFGKKYCLCRPGFTQKPGEEACDPNEFSCGRDGEGPLRSGGDRLLECDLTKTRAVLQTTSFYSPAVIHANETTSADRYLTSVIGMVDPTLMSQMKSLNDATVANANKEEARSKDCSDPRRYYTDSCPSTHYCVPSHDDPLETEHFTGFCCRKPKMSPPKCPVGTPHTSSVAPNYGCINCPLSHYCHQDPYTTELSVCCPKPCVNPDDIFSNGQCFPAIGDNQDCEVDLQCDIGARLKQMKRSAAVTKDATMKRINVNNIRMTPEDPHRIPVKCIKAMVGKSKCGCDRGYVEMQGSCQRARCTVGFGSEPLTGNDGRTRRCIPQSQQTTNTISPSGMNCPQPYICDPEFAVCCKSYTQFMCPTGYMQDFTTPSCTTNFDCPIVSGHICLNNKCCRKG